MSRLGDSYTAAIRIVSEKRFVSNLFESLSCSAGSDDRVSTTIRQKDGKLDINIKAKDFNMLLAVNNNMMQAIKMLESVNLYE